MASGLGGRGGGDTPSGVISISMEALGGHGGGGKLHTSSSSSSSASSCLMAYVQHMVYYILQDKQKITFSGETAGDSKIAEGGGADEGGAEGGSAGGDVDKGMLSSVW